MLFFESLRSERQLMEVVADRLSLRWYLGYDLDERLPDHSSLSKIRERYGPRIFRRFFKRIVEMCVEAGLVRGEELFIDATKVEAGAAVDSLAPRWFVEAHLHELFEGDAGEDEKMSAEGPSDTQDARPEDEGAVRYLCPRQQTRTSFGPTAPAKTGSPAAVPRTAPSRGPPGANGPQTPVPRGPTPMPPP